MHSHYYKNGPKVVFTILDVRDKHPGPVYHLSVFEPDKMPFEKRQIVIQCVQPERRLFRTRVHVAGHLIGIAVERLVEKGVLDGIRNFKAVYCRPYWIAEFEGLIGRESEYAVIQINQEVDELVKRDSKCHLRLWSIGEAMERKVSVKKMENARETKQEVRCVEIDGVGAYACSRCPFVSKIGVLGRVKVVSIHLHKKRDVTRMWYGIQLEAP